MELISLNNIFSINYGHSLELNALEEDSEGISFIGRSEKNNGMTGRVKKIPSLEPNSAGQITVALSGSVLATFLQDEEFYTGYHIACLSPKIEMPDLTKLYYCECISTNSYRYNYGRQANRTLKELLVPSPESVPLWARNMTNNDCEHDLAVMFIKKHLEKISGAIP